MKTGSMKNLDTRFVFTDKKNRELTECGDYFDAVCPYLMVRVSDFTSSYYYMSLRFKKVIGSVFEVPLDDARKIARNITENLDTAIKAKIPNRMGLYKYIKQNGYFTSKKIKGSPEVEVHGTSTILAQENSSLKQKLKELEDENRKLLDERKWYVQKIDRAMASLEHIQAEAQIVINSIFGDVSDE